MKKVSKTDKLIARAKAFKKAKAAKKAAKKAAFRKFVADKKAKAIKQQKALLAYKKAKAQGLNPKVPTFLKPKKLVARALKPNPKREAKKSAVEKKADALIR